MSGKPILYDYQRDWVEDRSRFKIGMFARQTGKTFTTTLDLVLSALERESGGGRDPWLILSRGERQSREAMDEGVKRHLQTLGAAFKAFDETTLINGTEYTTHEVVLPGGTKITGLPANPDTARGYSRNAFLDEFAFHAESRKIWQALFPVVSAGWRSAVTSTPNGKGNKFHELMTDRGLESVWSRHQVDIHRAVADGLPRDIEELRAGLNDEEAWAQEYELRWLDEATAWLPYELISSVEDQSAGIPELYQGGPSYIGNDIARRRDLWIAWVLEAVGDVLWARETVELRNAPFRVQDEALDHLVERYDVRRISMDQTGMGEKPVEDAAQRYGASRVEGVLFTGPTKQALATQGKERFEDRLLRIPEGDPKLRKDLHSLRKVTTPAGNVRFDASRDSDGHADRAWALMLAIEAASTGGTEYGYHPVRSPRRSAPGAGRDFFRPDHSGDYRPPGRRGGYARHGRGAL